MEPRADVEARIQKCRSATQKQNGASKSGIRRATFAKHTFANSAVLGGRSASSLASAMSKRDSQTCQRFRLTR
jgi:branched-subunit amino acid ABC-type transport system permease component